MNPSPSSPSRRGFLTASGAVGMATGVGSAQTTTDDPAANAPEPKWTVSRSDGFYYTVIADGVVYALAASVSMEGNPNEANIHTIDLSSGKKKWSARYPSVSTFSVENDTLYIIERRESASDPTKTIIALNTENGQERWRFPLPGYPRGIEVANGRVYVGGRSTTIALDEESGKKRWDAETKGERAYRLIHVGKTLYVGTQAGVYAYSNDGTERWNTVGSDLGTVYLTVADEKRIYCLNTNEDVALALSPKGGTELWSVSLDDKHYTTPVLHEETLYHWGGKLSAIDVTSGTMRWQSDKQFEKAHPRPIVVDSTIFAMSEDGALYALDDGGSVRWTFDTGDSQIYYWGDVRDGVAYVITDRGLTAVSADDGNRRWLFETDESARVVSISDEFVVLGTEGGLYGFERNLSLLSTVVDETAGFLTSGTGIALSGVLLGTGVFAAYRRMNADSESGDSTTEPELEPEPELGRLERIASDEFTETFRVRKRGDDRPVVAAEKRLTDPNLAEQFHSAVTKWIELSDRKGVVPVLDSGDDWVEFPYYEGGSLANSERPVEEQIMALSDANMTVHRAHSDGLVHGGLAPETILLDGDGRGGVTDWELATVLVNHRGSTPYDAPEQVAGESADERTDVYRLGAIARYLATDAVSGDARSDETNQSISNELDGVLSKAMADDPDDRYKSVVKFDDMLRWAAFRA